MASRENRYVQLIEKIFLDRFKEGDNSLEFERTDFDQAVADLGIATPRNLGDVIYSFRFRNEFPASIIATQPNGKEWIIEGAGKGKYRFKLVTETRILPRTDLITICIPDSTPEIIRSYALDDEQALLAIVRYNRLIDTFLGLTTYSLQNHLRTTVKSIGQIEIDELYVGVDKGGCHYVIPVQAKGGRDQIGVVQTTQDVRFVETKFDGIKCRAVAAQFMSDDTIALFELTLLNEDIKVVDEKHYKLVPASEIDPIRIRNYR